MKVWVLIDVDWESDYLMGVFASPESAMKAYPGEWQKKARFANPQEARSVEWYECGDMTLEEHEVQS